MAEGRMIVKGIGKDPRIRDLSETAQRLWPYILPHTEFGGILPRDAHELRLTCFPDWKLSDEQVELSILEWMSTKPPIAQETTTKSGNKRLLLLDFQRCNEHLIFSAARQKRWREKHSVTLRNISNVSNGRSEVKGSEVKRKETAVIGVMTPPSPGDVVKYAKTIGFEVDAERFCDHYAIRGWKLSGGVPMLDWQAAVRTWKRNARINEQPNSDLIAKD